MAVSSYCKLHVLLLLTVALKYQVESSHQHPYYYNMFHQIHVSTKKSSQSLLFLTKGSIARGYNAILYNSIRNPHLAFFSTTHSSTNNKLGRSRDNNNRKLIYTPSSIQVSNSFLQRDHMRSPYRPFFITNPKMNEGDDNKMSNNHEEIIIQNTSSWIKNVVIRLNLCPFADQPYQQSKLFIHVVRGEDIEEIISTLLYECILRKDEEGTSVVVCPELCVDDFEGYLDVVDMMENVLEDYKLKDDIQIAPFHPMFEFQDAGSDAIDNFTNRSPYPMFHILREEEVAIAVKKLDGDSSKVFQKNINLLNKLESKFGREDAEKVMRGEHVEGLQELLRSKDL